jgi:hypothetical protein
MSFRLPRRWLLLGAVTALGCYSPTLPLPPPVKPDITFTETGAFRVHGAALPNSQVFALNTRTQLLDGQQTGGTGVYDFELHDAEAGDEIDLWYQAGTDLSPPTSFDLPSLSPSGTGGGTGAAGAGGAGTAGSDR